MYIENATIEDIDLIFDFYDKAIAYQKTVFHKQWEFFERPMVEQEIQENKQWKIIIDGRVACIFALAYEDEELWKEKSKQPAIYIHRIVTHPDFRGNGFVEKIIVWARQFCAENNKEFIRLDTWGDNPRLVNYYIKCGFNYLGTVQIGAGTELPAHYKGALALFEIKL